MSKMKIKAIKYFEKYDVVQNVVQKIQKTLKRLFAF